MRIRNLAAVLALPFLVGFTWPSPPVTASPASPPSVVSKARVRTLIKVRNDNWNTVNVYLMRAGMTHRLGMVQTGMSRTFTMPVGFQQAGGDVRLVVNPVGPLYGYVSSPLIFTPGQTINLDVQPDLFMSMPTVG